MFKNAVLSLVLAFVGGLVGCSGGGGETKPQPPPPVMCTITAEAVVGAKWDPASVIVLQGSSPEFKLTPDPGYTNPVVTSKPNASISVSQNLVAGAYTVTVNAVSSSLSLIGTLTPPPPPPVTEFVNAEIAVLRNGSQCIVFAESSSSSSNIIKASKYILYKKDPGSGVFALFGQFTKTEDLPSGSGLSSQFTDVVPLTSIEGTVFKEEIEELVSGLKTSVITTVSSEEKFQAVALADSRSIKITFPGNTTPFVVYVYKMVSQWPIRYLSAPLFPSQDGVVVVPEGYPTTGSPIVVVVGYPDAVSYTSYVK